MYFFEVSARRARGEREESRATLSRVTLISRTLLLGLNFEVTSLLA